MVLGLVFFIAWLWLEQWAASAGLQPASNGFWGEGAQDNMPAIGKDNGFGSSAAGHINQQPLIFSLLDGSFGRGGVWGSYGDNPVHG
jgi:hypothetical protein